MTIAVPFISVIIPTYNRSLRLASAIESFLEQEYPKDRYEIIVVDNNSSDNTREVVERFVGSSNVSVRYLFEKRQGVHFARNSAAKQSAGDILYFTDDDMIADKSLLLNMIKVFAMNYNVGSATGRVLPKWESDPPEWILKYCCNWLLSLNDRSEQILIAPYDVGIFSCHQAILREPFFKSGGFNPENTAGEWIGDGETGLNTKIMELGYSFAYNYDSLIYHVIPSDRLTQSYLNKRFANQGNCDSYTDYRKHRHNNIRLILNTMMYLKNICTIVFLLVINVVLLRDYWRVHFARVYYNVNRIKYDIRLLLDKEWRNLVLKYNWLEE